VFTPSASDASFDPQAIVVNPEFVLPFSDDELLARRHSVQECLELYRRAYTPTAGSPAIDAASPLDAQDAQVTDGKCDIGAVEYTRPATAPTATSAPAGK